MIRDGSGALKHDWMPLQHVQPNQAVPYEVLPENEMPYVINPQSGYVANANNDPIGFSLDNNSLNQLRPGGGIYYLDVGGASAYRMGRIDRKIQGLIAAGGNITSNDMKTLQANNQLMDAELVLPHLFSAFQAAAAPGAWPQLASLAAEPRIAEAVDRLQKWDYSTPTGIQQGYDAGDNPAALPAPSQGQIDASVAASIYAAWRSTSIRNTIDKTLTSVGLGNYKPGSRDAQAGFKFMLDNYAALGGKGASGLTFFGAAGAPNAGAARIMSCSSRLPMPSTCLPARVSRRRSRVRPTRTTLGGTRCAGSSSIIRSGAPFSMPGPNGYGFGDLSAGLKGIARPGGFESVDAASHDARGSTVNSFMFGSGPARRFVGEMFPTISASEIIPGGQSGVLGNPLYVGQLGRWLTNQYHPLPIPASAALAQGTSVLNFVPH
ncbi:MAG: penicillin acylase family protein [Xanthomonadales bacterium]|nr:penicillin acylase family protein [Xanthomonadales bacterium]